MPSATATAGSMALSQNRHAHATMRMDNFLRHTDPVFQHAEAPTQGDVFVRKMATYGQVRPSVSFTNEPRVTRPFKDTCSAVDMSDQPMHWMDPKGDQREGTLEYPLPPKDVDQSYLKMLANHSLMLPSERYKEHLAMKVGEQKWREDRDAIFKHRKRMQVLERHYPNGVVGLDGPMHPGTILYKDKRAALMETEERRNNHAAGRHEHLHGQTLADDTTAFRDYGVVPDCHHRSTGVCIQRKKVDPEEHPCRFMDTHERLFPSSMPTWDPDRAKAMRSHQIRDRSHNIISGSENSIKYEVARRWDAPPLPGMPHQAAHPYYKGNPDAQPPTPMAQGDAQYEQ